MHLFRSFVRLVCSSLRVCSLNLFHIAQALRRRRQIDSRRNRNLNAKQSIRVHATRLTHTQTHIEIEQQPKIQIQIQINTPTKHQQITQSINNKHKLNFKL